jgi:hypothetical protein
MGAKGKLGSKLDDVTDCCNQCLIADHKVPDGTIPNPDGTMSGTFHFAAGDIAPFLNCVATCLQRRGYTCNIAAIFPTQEEFLAADLATVIANIDTKTT